MTRHAREARSMIRSFTSLRMRSRAVRSAGLAVGTWLVLLAGCAPLPDVSGFASASGELALATRGVGEATVPIIRGARGDEAASTFAKNWGERVATMNAMARYADALAEITANFGNARRDAEALAASVERLASESGLLPMGSSAAVGIATDIATLVVTQLQQARAARDLREALERVDPVVQLVAARLGRSISADAVAGGAGPGAGSGPGSDAADLAMFLNGAEEHFLTERVRETTSAMDTIAAARAARERTVSGLAQGNDEATARALQLAQIIDAAQREADAAAAPIDAELARVRAARRLLIATAQATDAWAMAHADLVRAMRDRRAISTDALAEAAVRIRDIIRRIEDQ